MILAAGLGTRMAPLTRSAPKPALPILGEPMVLRMIRRLAERGVTRVVVNVHAHASRLEAALEGSPIPVHLSHEPTLLGSAGGIQAARDQLAGDAPFLVVNGDMTLDLDLAELLRTHGELAHPATMLLREDPRKQRFGTIGYTGAGAVCRITDRIRCGEESGSGLFTGVQVMEPEILDRFPRRGELIPDVYEPLLRSGPGVGVALQSPALPWTPVGTPAELLDANLEALRQEVSSEVRVDPSARIEGTVEGPAWIGPEVVIAAGARIGPDAVVGRAARVAPGCVASEVLLLPGASPPAGEPLRRVVAFEREIWRDA